MAWLVDYPREKVNWHPIINLSKCVKCGMYMSCDKKVYSWTKNGPVIARPNECVVGCTTCANLCQGEAITFPNVKELRELYKREHLRATITRQMKNGGKLTFVDNN